jgi:hypothetical protein
MLQTFTSGDFNIFLKDFGSRIGDMGTWPEHTAGRYANYSYSTSDLTCGNVSERSRQLRIGVLHFTKCRS